MRRPSISTAIYYLLYFTLLASAEDDTAVPPQTANRQKFAIEIINDLVLVSQTTLSCNPLFGTLGPGMTVMQASSCTYNAIACNLNLSSKILEGWDMLDNDAAIKSYLINLMNMHTKTFSEPNEEPIYLQDIDTIKEFINDPSLNQKDENGADELDKEISDKYKIIGALLFNPLDLHTDIYFKLKKSPKQEDIKIGCVNFRYGQNSIFTHRNLEIETCFSKYGIKQISSQFKERGIVKAAIAVYDTMRELGLSNSIKAPKELYFAFARTFAGHYKEGIQKLNGLIEKVNDTKWDGKKIEFELNDNSMLLMSVTAKKLSK